VIYKVGLWFAGKFGNGRRRLVQWRRRRCNGRVCYDDSVLLS